jgi:hypothetical protein
MSMDSVIYRFKSAARRQGRDIAEIEVHAPRMRDLRTIEASAGKAVRIAAAIGTLTGLTRGEIGALHIDDVRGLSEVVATLFRHAHKISAS